MVPNLGSIVGGVIIFHAVPLNILLFFFLVITNISVIGSSLSYHLSPVYGIKVDSKLCIFCCFWRKLSWSKN